MASTMKPLTPAEMGRRGGKARMRQLSTEERSALGRKAGKASGRARRRKPKPPSP